MTSKERLKQTLNHESPDKIVIDFGSTPVSGIHVLTIERLRDYYGLPRKPIKITDPFQMLGEIEDDLAEILGIDIIGLSPKQNMFGIAQENWKEFKTFWGQTVLVPGEFNTTLDSNNDLLIYPKGNTSVAPSAKMPKSGYFFDAIIRQPPIVEEELNVEDNLEEFAVVNDEDLQYWKASVDAVADSGKGIIANFGGTGLGDIALVPGNNLENPKGIRDVAEWYMSTMMRPDYVHGIFEKQTEIALENLSKLFKVVGNRIDVAYICGTDFGTQVSTFCDSQTYMDLWHPYYKKINDWIHQNTSWKTFKHCCGAIEPFIPLFIDSGFDIINPVQINAEGMDPKRLKDKYGDKITFWGGGIDTQKVLPSGTPGEVEKQVIEQCEILGKNGGFVFNAVHNIQANVPIENVVAMVNAIHKVNG
ncbi:MAG: uroporphyrinogen decarboxylase family protein [Bacteroidota bacterium]